MMLQLPKILNVPQKLLPFIFNFDKFNYHLLEGGRGGGKSHGVARFYYIFVNKDMSASAVVVKHKSQLMKVLRQYLKILSQNMT